MDMQNKTWRISNLFGFRLLSLRFSFTCVSMITLFIALAMVLQIGAFDRNRWSLLDWKAWPKGSFIGAQTAYNWSLCSNGNNNDIEALKNDIQKTLLRMDAMERKLKYSITFLPLKDLSFEKTADDGHTWFMSSFKEKMENPTLGNLYFPSNSSKGRILCILGRDRSDGAKNSYGLAWKEHLPRNFTLLPGLTFVSNNYWDYKNLWHGLTTLVPFVWWHKFNECAVPDRFVLYHWGEIVSKMGSWISEVLHASFGRMVPVDVLDYGDGPVCFERAVIYRRGISHVSLEKRMEVFDIIRCKARQFCRVAVGQDLDLGDSTFNFTLLTRAGNRSFRNESIIASIFEEECKKVIGCRFRAVRADGLSFCDQVQLMSTTQVVATVHGAQLANMIFMSKGSHIMEIFPKGWLELAGAGQYVFHWLADWMGMKHEGTWRDTEGPECPYPERGDLECFFFYKDRQVGFNRTFLSSWASNVLKRFNKLTPLSGECPC
ncbi:uncharacterized protein LOC18431988 isoform X2 [Amborella trichopoda]|uniref:uncharacterized protein LOC18431988 isoform X2 n=1 Tax=Amborella trichopoda TaxID=13333 RepID=UPI0009C0F22D|nr:uncharacterized protein LOC18431988 isoform X2 [Amborella trichopoda]|eukprot:XP_011622560.2 uncharacterized protein LOC18431988 isoform X2 [Amborella trichopoda]